MGKDEQSTDDEQVAADVWAVLGSEVDETENSFDNQLHQFSEDRSRSSSSSSSKSASRKTKQPRIPINQERKKTRERLEADEIRPKKRKKTGDTKSSSSNSKSTPITTTTTATVNQQKNKTTTKEKNEKKKKKTDEEEIEKEEEEVAYVSIVAIPKTIKKTREVRELYSEIVKYAVEAMEGREKRGCGRSREEKELWDKWSRMNRELSLDERHGGKLKWKIEEEGGAIKENNKILSAKLNKVVKEMAEWKGKVAENEVRVRVEGEVKKQVMEFKDRIDEDKKGELGELRRENGELKMKIGELRKELEIRRESEGRLVEKVKKSLKGRRGKRRKKNEKEQTKQEEEEEGKEEEVGTTRYRVLKGKYVHASEDYQ